MPRRPLSDPSRPTISTVAEHAGVSPATAARALGGYGYVSDAVREKVQVTADALGYRTNSIARSMVTRSTRTLGVVVADISNPFFGAVVKGVSEVARLQSFDVLVIDTDEDLAIERSGVENLLGKQVDALIVASAEPLNGNAPHLVKAIKEHVPVVLIDRYVTGLKADSVITDSRKGINQSVREIISSGHRRIGFLWGPETPAPPHSAEELMQQMKDAISPGADRIGGYLDAHQEAGLEVDVELVALVPQSPAAGQAAMLRMLADPDPPTAVITTDSIATLSALAAIRQVHARCPEDISLFGFDDTPWAAYSDPPLTMLDQSGHALGRTAATKAIARISGDTTPPSKTLLEMTVVRRQSLGPGPFAMRL